MTRPTATRWTLWVLVLGYSFFLGGHLFEITALVPNWRSGSPVEVGRYRDFLAHSGPGVYFQRVLMPTLVAAVLAAVLTWSKRSLRRVAPVPLLVILLYGAWTVLYFVPINRYIGQSTYDPATLKRLVEGWVFWETPRACLIALGLVAAIMLLEQSTEAGGGE
jgi:Domain of unknown function (DUF1772)